MDLDALDGADGTCSRENSAWDTLELGNHSVEELVGSDKDDESCVLNYILETGGGNEVLGEVDIWEVSLVAVGLVDDLGELLAVDLLLADPHANFGVEVVIAAPGVLSSDLGQGSSPRAGSDDCDLVLATDEWRGWERNKGSTVGGGEARSDLDLLEDWHKAGGGWSSGSR